MAPSPYTSYNSYRGGGTDIYQTADLYRSRSDYSSYARCATPPPDARRGAYAPSPPRNYYDSYTNTSSTTSPYTSAYSSYKDPTVTSSYNDILSSYTKDRPTYEPISTAATTTKPWWGSVPRVRDSYAPGSLIPESDGTAKYSVVFDLDETLCYARAGNPRGRPGLQEVLSSARGAEIIVWTAGEQRYAEGALRSLGASDAVHHLIPRSDRWYSFPATKNLSKLGRDLSHTIIIENTAQCIEGNADAAILLPDFTGGAQDSALPALSQVLSGLVASGQTVQEYLRNSPLLTQRQVRANGTGKTFSAYTLKDHAPNDCIDAAKEVGSYLSSGYYGSSQTATRSAYGGYSASSYATQWASAYGQTA